MDKERPSEFAQRLLTPPVAFRRERTRSYLYAPYSRKLHRRVYVYTHLGYDLWALLESDPCIRTFNERPPKLSIPLPDGATAHIVPAAVSEGENGVVTIHSIDNDRPEQNEDRPSESDLLMAWAAPAGFSFTCWTAETLRPNPIRVDNLKRLLRYASAPQIVLPPKLVDDVSAVLKQHRKITLISLIESITDSDPEWIARVVAQLILDGRCFSDIDTHPFDNATELSVHHATGE